MSEPALAHLRAEPSQGTKSGPCAGRSSTVGGGETEPGRSFLGNPFKLTKQLLGQERFGHLVCSKEATYSDPSSDSSR